MLTRFIIMLAVVAGSFILTAPMLAQSGDTPSTTVDPAQAKRWISELASDNYTIREAASKELIKRGPAVLDVIAEHGASGDAELLWRSIHIVQQIALSGDIDLLDRCMNVLEQFRKAAPPGSNVMLGANAEDLRNRFREHAEKQIAELGGVISRSHLGGGLGVDLGPGFKGTDKHLRYLKVLGSITYMRLTGEKFNDASLDHLSKMTDLQQLHLMETGVTTVGQRALEKNIEGIKILRFGSAVIGISGVTHSGRCLIQAVQPGTGAASGGLRPGDMVTSLDGKDISSFEDLVGIVAEKKVDQQVKVEVLRAGKTSEHLVTLTRRPSSSTQRVVPHIIPGPIEIVPGP